MRLILGKGIKANGCTWYVWKSNNQKMKIHGLCSWFWDNYACYVPICLPLNSLGFNAMTYWNKSFPFNLRKYIRFWVGTSVSFWLSDFKIGISFFLFYVKTEHIYYLEVNSCRNAVSCTTAWKVQFVWVVLEKSGFMC